MKIGKHVLCLGQNHIFRITELTANSAFLVHTKDKDIEDGTVHGWELLVRLVPANL